MNNGVLHQIDAVESDVEENVLYLPEFLLKVLSPVPMHVQFPYKVVDVCMFHDEKVPARPHFSHGVTQGK